MKNTKIKYYLKEMRIHHYIKNFLIFVPLCCSGQLFVYKKLINALIAFLCFCFISSTIYIINDIKDIEKDKNHPIKCKRPLAAGNIKIKNAIILAILLFTLAIVISFVYLGNISLIFLLLYFFVNMAYSFGLKNIALLDIIILVVGFLIRVIYGSFVTNITISSWLYLVVISASFYLGFGKRRNELKNQNQNKNITREVIEKYPLSFLEKNMNICMTLILVFYSLWTVDSNTIALYNGKNLIWTVPLVMLIFMKYSLIIEGDSEGNPVEVLVSDKILIGLCFLYVIVMFILLYVY